MPQVSGSKWLRKEIRRRRRHRQVRGVAPAAKRRVSFPRHPRRAQAGKRLPCLRRLRAGGLDSLEPSPQRPVYDKPGDTTGPLPARDPSPSCSGRRDGSAGMGGLSLADALLLCELLANTDPARYERAALRWLLRFINERSPPLTEAAIAASALAELRHGNRNVGVEALKRLIRHG
jgi:hypothetical protein